MSRPLAVAIALLSAAPLLAAPVPKVVLSPELEAEFDRLWDDAGWGGPAGVHLYCRLIAEPEAGVAYLTNHVPPAELTKLEANDLLKALGSEDAKVWKPAYRALSVRDMRLADLSPVDAWNDAATAEFRQRLGALLYGWVSSPDHIRDGDTYKLIAPRKPGEKWDLYRKAVEHPGRPPEVYSDVALTYPAAEPPSRNHFRERRAVVAVAALEHVGTPAARRHLESLAGGNGLSSFTVHAKRVLEPAKTADPKASKSSPADLWALGSDQLFTPGTVDRFLASPKETVALFKTKLKPLTLSKADGAKLLARLFSDDAKEVAAALTTIRYYDLRLAMSVEDAWAEAKTPAHRGRLVTALWVDRVAVDLARVDESRRYFDYTFRAATRDFNYWHYFARLREGLSDEDVAKAGDYRGITPVANSLDLLADYEHDRWPHEESAIYILDVIGTEDALAIIKDMATGHEDAGPTKGAKAVLARRAKR